MGNMRFKVGDRVRIKSLDWYNKNKDNYGAIYAGNGFCFWKNMVRHCGEIMKITTVKVDPEDSNKGYYFMENSEERWTDEMIEGIVDITQDRVDKLACKIDEELPSGNPYEWECPEDYVFKDENGNVINATKIVLEKKNLIREEQIDNAAQEYIDSDNAVLTYSDGFCEQTDHPFIRAAFKAGVEWADNNVTQDDCSKAPKLTSQDYSNGRFGYQLPAGFKAKLTERELILTPEKLEYPKTYEECCEIFQYNKNLKVYPPFNADIPNYNALYLFDLLESLRKLLICRDAYWKIAGEEMGLGKPWNPNWRDDDEKKHTIEYYDGEIIKDVSLLENRILVFPTPEMRDAFYENFKSDIEFCKELL